MNVTMDDGIKRWTAKRKTALVIEIIQRKTTVAAASRSFDLSPSEIEGGGIDDAKLGMENSLRANPLDIREQYEKQLKDLQEAYGEAMLELRAKNSRPCWVHRIEPWLRHWFEKPWRGNDPEHPAGPSRGGPQGTPDHALRAGIGGPRRTAYYRAVKAASKVDPRFAEPIKAMIEKEPSFGYRTVAWLLGSNKNTVQRVFQLKGWQVRSYGVKQGFITPHCPRARMAWSSA